MDIGHALSNSLHTFELTDVFYPRQLLGLFVVPIGAILTFGYNDFTCLKLDNATSSIATLKLSWCIGKLDGNFI